MRILGIDYGDRRIGLALSDPLGFTAQGLETLENKGVERTLEAIHQLCKDRGVTEIVVGLPVNMDGTIGPRAKGATEFSLALGRKTALPVRTWDERLTSRQVERLLAQGGASRRAKKAANDRLAATVLLQSYLESKRS
ncbi:MAG: hypothetical protein A3D28_05495 [Omnitrophica bacterium RIFCSPHIGHO2_02_FULL_63_14]|nr:MAG: hypothetical protein A3D28_05495 [Omnitrophica bacterium RIFCSPHIGHO2_02_FULL_63_14]